MSMDARARGFSLVEAMITIAVLAVLAAAAMPTFSDFFERARLRSASEQIVSFLGTARQEGIKRDRDVTVATSGSGATWCLGAVAAATPGTLGDPVVESPAACDCAGAPAACSIGGVQQVLPSSGGVTLTGANEFTFSSKLGTLADLSAVGDPIVMKSKNAVYELQINVSALGHARACVVSGKKAIPGVPTCV